jgi:serine/threonine-protein kinase
MRDEMIGATFLGRYRVVARLARGGMGVVYLARAEGAAGFAKPVVVKRVLPDLSGEERMARLFVREAKILANLQHPNIVSVIDFGQEDGAYIMVLDYVRAYNLNLWWAYRQEKGERSPAGETIHIIIKVLDALEYAHTLTSPDGTTLDIVHADVSPSNILVDTDGQVKLLDFGIARMRGESTQSTDSNSIRGKFAYLPVESLDGSPPSVATDIYAAGVTLYELLTGENPFSGGDETRTVAKVISHEPTPVSQVRPDVPAELDAILARAMHKDRTQRFASAKDFARELRRAQKMLEDEATSSLATLAKRDYAAMPMKAGATLAELEDSWRNPTTASAKLPKADVQSEPPKSSGRLYLGIGVGLAVAGAAVGLGIFFKGKSDDDDKKIVVIEHNPTSATAPGPIATASHTAETASAAPAVSSAAPAVAPPVKKTAGDPLSAALAKNQPEIEGCFQSNASDLSGNPEVSVRFAIDTEGTVQRAEVFPSELASAPLGQCLLGVARKTKFPPQAAPATFRIPLRARKVP